MFRVCVMGILQLLFLLLHRTAVTNSCPLEYYTIDPNHSFCSRIYPGASDQPVTSAEREHILQVHNHERRLVRATNMQTMHWSDELATIALHYARACNFDHDTNLQRTVPRIPLPTGQNLAMGYENWTQALEGWVEEKEHYYYRYPSTGMVGHYTQIIWHSAVLVGCAAAICPPYGPYLRSWPHYVCNYITGQLNSNIHPPYDEGHEDRPLHDCQGKVCLYNGTLNLNTCQCQCSSYASGDQCEYLNCDNLPPCYYSPSACVAVNVPLECPRVCGLCDRYEMLKQVYGENNLAPHRSTTTLSSTPSSTIKASTKRIVGFRKLKQKQRTRLSMASTVSTTGISSTETVSFHSSSSSSTMIHPHILFPFLLFLLHSMCDYHL